MKRIPWILIALTLIVSACTPASTATPTSLPPTVESGPTSLPPTTAPTLIPVALSGPQSSATMPWLDGSNLVYIAAGDFMMGTGASNAHQKTVTLDGYWIQSTDVTNKMYAQCVATGNCAAPAQELGAPVYTNADYGDYPVVGVTWDMAANYCQWVQGQLPTEAQWEKAARGQNGSTYPWGEDKPACDVVNMLGCLGHTSGANDYPSGKSPYGLSDMEGNVFQWVNDYYSETYYDSMPLQNPPGPDSGDSRVIRGSSFESDDTQMYAGLRHFGDKAYHSRDLSFRCAVPQPKMFAPYCQTNSYFPTGAVSTSTCQAAQADVRGNYCVARSGYTTIDIQQGATYQVQTKGYECTEAVVDGQRRLTCSGPRDSSGELMVCNPACSGSPGSTGAAPVCDPGYNRDPNTGACLYQPISGQPGVAGCPQGYNLIDRGSQKVCVVSLNQNGQCPIGLYFDSSYGACVPPSGNADAPYGIDNSSLAAQTYQGCTPGYTYDPNYQCCQANAGGAYPGCPLGFKFDSTQNTCVPSQVQLSAPGCVTVQLNIAKCGEPIDVCSKITQEPVCLRNSYACQWDDNADVCSMKPGQ
ncbi:MAG TPA: formylglycine-generating enzyme family protein [Anaerolineales bacterium]|nr:formylglycine-generating enzyme family protein [Anaerolineales bacterium]